MANGGRGGPGRPSCPRGSEGDPYLPSRRKEPHMLKERTTGRATARAGGWRSGLAVGLAAAATVLVAWSAAVPRQARAADHRDSPAMINDPAADLLDVYAFVNPNDHDKVILALTV